MAQKIWEAIGISELAYYELQKRILFNYNERERQKHVRSTIERQPYIEYDFNNLREFVELPQDQPENTNRQERVNNQLNSKLNYIDKKLTEHLAYNPKPKQEYY